MTIPYDFYVLDDLSQDIIFGMNFLTSTQARIDCANHTITLFDGMIAVNTVENFEKCTNTVCLTSRCVLPPRSESIVQLSVLRPTTNSTVSLIFEPLQPKGNQDFLMARALVCNRENSIVGRILNPTNDEIRLHAGMPVGNLVEIEPESITVIPDESESERETSGNNFSEFLHNHPNRKTIDELGIKIQNDNLLPEQRQRLIQLIEHNSDIFATSLTDLPGTHLCPHEIDTGDSLPVRQRPYRHNPVAQREIERQTQEMLDCGIIEPSTSMYNSPCLLVKKKGGEARLVIDYRALNKVTRKISYPLPVMSEIVNAMSDSQPSWFSLADLKSGYWQQPLSETSKPKTTFATHQGSYQFNFLPFGLAGSPAAFQKLMLQVFQGLTFKFLIIYVDDILIFSKTFDQHLSHLQTVFNRLRDANLRLHPKKCNFVVPEILYLGHIISPAGIAVDPSKIEILKTYPPPRNVKQVRSFLGYCSYYRRFVKNFAQIAQPLNSLLHKGKVFHWTDACQQAFEKLRTAMYTTPILAYADMNKQFILSTDASSTGLGYVLSQIDDKHGERPLACGGRALRDSEKNWSTTELEGLALVEAVREFHYYLANQKFLVYSDHISLSWLKEIKHRNGRLFRWSLLLQNYDMEIKYKTGKSNANADMLSRIEHDKPTPENPEDDIYDQIMTINHNDDTTVTHNSQSQMTLLTFEYESEQSHLPSAEGIAQPLDPTIMQSELHAISVIENLAQKQRDCTDIGRIIKYIEEGELPQDGKLARQTVYEAEDYFFKNDILYHKHIPRNQNLQAHKLVTHQIAVPQSLRTEILRNYHETGHVGVERVYASIRHKYYWPTLYADCRQYVKTCLNCQRAKRDYHKKSPPLQPLETVGIFERWQIDIIGPFPVSNGYKYVLTCVESFTRFPEFIPLENQEAITVADAIFNHLVCRYGTFSSLLSDRGCNFLSEVVKRLCQLCSIKQVFTSAYHPQCNGLTERIHSTLLNALRSHLQGEVNWPDFLGVIAMSYRSTIATSSHEYSPFYLMHGQDMRLAVDVDLIKPKVNSKTADEYIEKLKPKLDLARQMATENLKETRAEMKQQHDRNVQIPKYKPGDKVWLHFPNKYKQNSKKLHIKWRGPYLIIRRVGLSNYILMNCETQIEIGYPVNVSRIKRYYDNRDQFSTYDTQRSMSQHEDTQLYDAQQSQTHSTNEQQTSTDIVNKGKWENCIELKAVKMIDGKRHFLVVWEDPTRAPSWAEEQDVGQGLITNFYLTHTKRGTRRRDYSTMQYQ